MLVLRQIQIKLLKGRASIFEMLSLVDLAVRPTMSPTNYHFLQNLRWRNAMMRALKQKRFHSSECGSFVQRSSFVPRRSKWPEDLGWDIVCRRKALAKGKGTEIFANSVPRSFLCHLTKYCCLSTRALPRLSCRLPMLWIYLVIFFSMTIHKPLEFKTLFDWNEVRLILFTSLRFI